MPFRRVLAVLLWGPLGPGCQPQPPEPSVPASLLGDASVSAPCREALRQLDPARSRAIETSNVAPDDPVAWAVYASMAESARSACAGQGPLAEATAQIYANDAVLARP